MPLSRQSSHTTEWSRPRPRPCPCECPVLSAQCPISLHLYLHLHLHPPYPQPPPPLHHLDILAACILARPLDAAPAIAVNQSRHSPSSTPPSVPLLSPSHPHICNPRTHLHIHRRTLPPTLSPTLPHIPTHTTRPRPRPHISRRHSSPTQSPLSTDPLTLVAVRHRRFASPRLASSRLALPCRALSVCLSLRLCCRCCFCRCRRPCPHLQLLSRLDEAAVLGTSAQAASPITLPANPRCARAGLSRPRRDHDEE